MCVSFIDVQTEALILLTRVSNGVGVKIEITKLGENFKFVFS